MYGHVRSCSIYMARGCMRMWGDAVLRIKTSCPDHRAVSPVTRPYLSTELRARLHRRARSVQPHLLHHSESLLPRLMRAGALLLLQYINGNMSTLFLELGDDSGYSAIRCVVRVAFSIGFSDSVSTCSAKGDAACHVLSKHREGLGWHRKDLVPSPAAHLRWANRWEAS